MPGSEVSTPQGLLARCFLWGCGSLLTHGSRRAYIPPQGREELMWADVPCPVSNIDEPEDVVGLARRRLLRNDWCSKGGMPAMHDPPNGSSDAGLAIVGISETENGKPERG